MSKRVLLGMVFAGAFSCAFMWTGTSAWAQPPSGSSVTSAIRETTRDVREEAEKKLIKAPRKTPEIKEGPEVTKFEGPSLFVKTITLTGVETFKPEDFRSLIQKFENRDVFEAELKEVLCKEIEREYLKKGVIAACFVPPQEIKDGALTLRVVEAKMGNLETEKTHFFNKDRLAYYWLIKAGEVLRYEKISRAMQFMNKNPDREVKATLHAGEKPETTDITLTSKTYFPVHVTAMMDNEGSVPTGKIRKGIGLVENNLIGLDDTLMVGYTGGKDFGGMYAYHKVPITPFGTSVMYGYSNTRSFPKKDFERYAISSSQISYSAFIYQDLYYKDDYKGEVSAGIERKDKRVVAESSGLPAGTPSPPGSTGDLNADRLVMLRLGLALLARDMYGYTYIKPEFSQGLNFLGARRKSELSSRDAENTPSKLVVNFNFMRRLVKNFQAQIKGSSMLASEKLMPQEELYLGGIDSVRGYPSGDYLADGGFYAQNEILIPAFFIPDWVRVPYGEKPVKDEITGVLFFDYGYGMKRGMIEGEQETRRMASLGAGVRFRLLNQATLRLEWGFPLDCANYPLTEFDRSRLHFSVDIQDQIPREVERLSKEYKECPNPLKYYAKRREKELAAQEAQAKAMAPKDEKKEAGVKEDTGAKAADLPAPVAATETKETPPAPKATALATPKAATPRAPITKKRTAPRTNFQTKDHSPVK